MSDAVSLTIDQFLAVVRKSGLVEDDDRLEEAASAWPDRTLPLPDDLPRLGGGQFRAEGESGRRCGGRTRGRISPRAAMLLDAFLPR